MFSIKKFILAGIGALVVVGAIVGVMWLRSRGDEMAPAVPVDEDQGGKEDQGQLPIGTSQPAPPPVQVPTVTGGTTSTTTKSPLEVEVGLAARNFTERFGSFSSHANYAHLTATMPLATTEMKEWLTSVITKNAVKDLSGIPFKGVTTRALATRVLSLDEGEGEAVVELDTQRIEVGEGTLDKNVIYQSIRIELVLQDEKWLVDSAFWGDIK